MSETSGTEVLWVHIPPYLRNIDKKGGFDGGWRCPFTAGLRWVTTSHKIEEVNCPKCIEALAQDVVEALSPPEAGQVPK